MRCLSVVAGPRPAAGRAFGRPARQPRVRGSKCIAGVEWEGDTGAPRLWARQRSPPQRLCALFGASARSGSPHGAPAPSRGPPARRPSNARGAARRRATPAALPCPQALAPPSHAQAAPSTGPSSMFNMLVDGYVRDGLLSREEAERCSREQLEFLIRKRTGSPPADASSSPPASAQSVSPDQVGSQRAAGCWGRGPPNSAARPPHRRPTYVTHRRSLRPAWKPSCRWQPADRLPCPAPLFTNRCRRACRRTCRTACSPPRRWPPAPRPRSSSLSASAPPRARATAWCPRRRAAPPPPPAPLRSARPPRCPPPTAGASRHSHRCERAEGPGFVQFCSKLALPPQRVCLCAPSVQAVPHRIKLCTQ